MKKILSLFCAAVLYLSFVTNLYSEQTNGASCEKCNRQFSISVPSSISAPSPKSVDPTEWGLSKGMTQSEVQAVLGKPSSIKNIEWYIWWYYPKDRRVEFWKNSKDGEYKLNFCAEVSSPPQPAPQQNTVTCPYCGITQDKQMAANRYVYDTQMAQATADAQATALARQANQQALSGFVQNMHDNMQKSDERRQQIVADSTNRYLNHLSSNMGAMQRNKTTTTTGTATQDPFTGQVRYEETSTQR